jgi:hypothetical protein
MLLWARKSRVNDNSVSGCVVIMEQPIVVELGVHGLAFGGKFKVHNPSNVEKHDKHCLGRAADLPRLRSWGSWAFPLWRLLFSLGIIPVDPSLVPIYEAVTKERVAALTEWRRSSGNRRMFLVRFENRTSSSGNGPGIDVSLHKGTILKGMLPKLNL